jgi:hypothetical protein
MSEMNPYQAPEFDAGLDKQERQAARQFLKLHDQGPSYAVFLRMHLPWLIARCLPVFLVAYLIVRDKEAALPVMGGLLAGTVSVELMYPRIVARLWPVYEKIIDWEKVRKMVE